ncbi:MAG: hypothetical protein IT164_06030 [Bryobacterales bacterium]|nr:hypothetical protein [Bryobacterales bacterium]
MYPVRLIFVLTVSAFAQQDAALPARDALALYTRGVQYMESLSVAVPELNRAGAPVVENCRQAAGTMTRLSGGASNSALAYRYLTNLRAFLALYDAVAKPHPFPDEARKQAAELREAMTRLDTHFRALLEQKEALVRGGDRDNLKRYAEANSRLGPPAPGKPRVVFLGDSITDGWRFNEYFPERDFINRGISGQITGQMLGRMKADVIDRQPAVMVLLGGTNDIARGVPVETIQNNIAMICDLAALHKIKVILASILPVSDYHKADNPSYERSTERPPQVIRQLNQWMMAQAKQRSLVYLDYHTAMADEAGMLKKDLADDGLHPNGAGYRIMAPLVLAAIDKSLPPAPEPKKTRRRWPFGGSQEP